MSLKGTRTTADYIEWNTMLTLIRRLYKDGDYTMSLFIGCGCFFRIARFGFASAHLENVA